MGLQTMLLANLAQPFPFGVAIGHIMLALELSLLLLFLAFFYYYALVFLVQFYLEKFAITAVVRWACRKLEVAVHMQLQLSSPASRRLSHG